MSDDGALYLVGGLVIGGVVIGAIAWRNRQAKASEQAPKKGACETISGAIGLDLPSSVCGAADSLLGSLGKLLSGPDWKARDRENQQLNGAIAEPVPEDLRDASWRTDTLTPHTPYIDIVRGSALRFENGCRPFEGAPGWEKCAPGTHDMFTKTGTATRAPLFPGETTKNVKTSYVRRDLSFTGRQGDAFSGQGLIRPKGDPMGSPVVATQNVYIAGRRVTTTCPGKARIERDIAVDHTQGGIGVQWCPNSTGPANRRGSSTTTTTGTVRTDAPRNPDGTYTRPTTTTVRNHT